LSELRDLAKRISSKPAPVLGTPLSTYQIIRAIFVPTAARGSPVEVAGIRVVTAKDVIDV
jgi:hypothetical protein